ncbi:MAG: MFS transporter, partial [Treponema sp.]|nr:MFS transporter [Treponema sp.]
MSTTKIDANLQKPGSKAWLMFIVIFIMCFITPILWFSAPPLHNSIAGLLVNGKFMHEPGYSVFKDSLSNQSLFGQTMSLIGLFALFSALAAGFLVKKLGVRLVMIFGGLLVVISAVVSALSGSNYNILRTGRALLGLAVGFIWVSSPTALSFWFREKNRALAMSLWGACVPLGTLTATNLIVNPMLKAGIEFHTIWWVMAGMSGVAALLVILIYRDPQREEGSEVSTQALPFKEIWSVFRQHQLLMIFIAWVSFTFINSTFTSYNVSFFQDSLNMDYLTANRWASIAAGAGICAPIFGFIADRINRYRRWILVSIGVLCLMLTGIFGFHVRLGPITGGAVMAIYLVVQFAANGILIAVIRPYIPMLVGRGGVTAVSLGLSMLTLLQFGIQFFTAPVFGGIQDAAVAAGASSAEAWAMAANFSIIPLGIVALICTFFIRQKPPSAP